MLAEKGLRENLTIVTISLYLSISADGKEMQV